MARNDWATFEEFSLDMANGVHNLGSNTFYLLLIDNTTPPTASDATPRLADYVANEVGTGGGYVANGIQLTGTSTAEAAGVTTFDDTGNISLSQDGSGFTDAYWGVLYNGTAAADQAIGFVDLGGPLSEVAGDITITWHASGIETITVTA